MENNYKNGQEMMNLDYLSPEEVKKMTGEPAHLDSHKEKDIRGIVGFESPRAEMLDLEIAALHYEGPLQRQAPT